MTDRYHVQVYCYEAPGVRAWRRVRPSGGDPYVFSESEAYAYLEAHVRQSGRPDLYRLEPLPPEKP